MDTTQSTYANESKKTFEGFLATVTNVFTDEKSMSAFKLDPNTDSLKIYNGNKNFTDIDTRFLGAIQYSYESAFKVAGYAYPFDKNNITFPIIGETVLILAIENNHYWLPYSNTIYPNYRENYTVSELTKERNTDIKPTKSHDYNEAKTSGIPNKPKIQQKSAESEYTVKETVHFLRPKKGDTIISGRVGQTIRFSEFFLTDDGKTSSPSLFISNKKDEETENKKIGELIEENINQDGSSIYMVSNKVKVPFKEVVKKEKIAFKDFPSSDKLKGNQIFINSDRVVIASKANEVIIFGAKNTGVITDGRFSVDAKNGVYVHSEGDDAIIHTINGKNIFLNSDSSGKIYLGKNKGEGGAGADVQKMVLGGELVDILNQLIDAIAQQVYLTPSGPTAIGPTNVPTFNAIKNKLRTILSARNFLSKQ